MNYIIQACKRAHPVTRRNVMAAVASILSDEAESGIDVHRKLPKSFDKLPKDKWWRLFRKRHPELTYRTPETLSSARKNISLAVVKQWFHEAHDYIKEVDALDALEDPTRNFNIDETSFSLSPKQGRVIAVTGEKLVFEEASLYQKTNITVVAIVSADGKVPPPQIIYPRKRISVNMAEQFPENIEFIAGKSEKGYITFETLYEYLCNGFHDWLNASNIKRPVILWTDWHESRSNYHLAQSLNDLGIILYGLPPNTTHFMQPLDVAVFGPLKKGWRKECKEWEMTHNDEILTQVNFAKVFLPVYHKFITSDNIKAGFKKCGLVPFDPEAPDYSKLEAAAAQREHTSTIYEGVDQGGYKEASSQTKPPLVINRTTQTSPGICVMTREEREKMCNLKGSLCDLVLEYRGYTHILTEYMSVPFTTESPPVEFQGNPRPHSSQDESSTQTETPSTSGKSSTISPAMKAHMFYPERREGRGPKKIRNIVDRVYSISSFKMVTEYKRLKEEKDKKEQAKGKKRETRKKGPAPKRKKQIISEPSSEEEDSPTEALEYDMETGPSGLSRSAGVGDIGDDQISLNDSSDESLNCDGDNFGYGITREEPKLDSWVGVKLEKGVLSCKGRKVTPFEVYIARITKVEEDGFEISFLKERSPGFYVVPDYAELSYPHRACELAVLEPPNPECRGRVNGFAFTTSIKEILISHFKL